MRAIERWIDKFCWKHPHFGVPGLMRYIVLANVLIFLLDWFSSGTCSALLGFYPGLVLKGEIWRLFTFVVVPEPYELTGLGPVWFAFSMLFYFSLGTAIEREWGTPKFSLFYLCGSVITLIAGFLTFGITHLMYGNAAGVFSYIPVTMGQVNFSILLAFATLFPDAMFRIYFLIPIKAKWLAIFYLLRQVWDIMRMSGLMLVLFLPIMLPLMLAALINYAFFFWSDITEVVGRAFRQAKHQNSKQTINFKKATKSAYQQKGYIHKCAVCGKTDTEYPDLEFRYCSKCNGYYCYCMEHINSHEHIK